MERPDVCRKGPASRAAGRRSRGEMAAPWNGTDACRVGWAVSAAEDGSGLADWPRPGYHRGRPLVQAPGHGRPQFPFPRFGAEVLS